MSTVRMPSERAMAHALSFLSVRASKSRATDSLLAAGAAKAGQDVLGRRVASCFCECANGTAHAEQTVSAGMHASEQCSSRLVGDADEADDCEAGEGPCLKRHTCDSPLCYLIEAQLLARLLVDLGAQLFKSLCRRLEVEADVLFRPEDLAASVSARTRILLWRSRVPLGTSKTSAVSYGQ
jgi:hypothetical protein